MAATRSRVGSPVTRKFTLAYNSTALTTGHALFTPAIGDVLLDVWVVVTTAWNATALLSVGTFVNGAAEGLPSWHPNLEIEDSSNFGDGVLFSPGGNDSLFGELGLRFKFTAANPLRIVVTQDGNVNGAASTATDGAAEVYVMTASPA
jgi:hypothetical protein